MLGILSTSVIQIDDSLWGGFLPNPASPTQALVWGIVSIVLLVSVPIHIRTVRRRRALRSADLQATL